MRTHNHSARPRRSRRGSELVEFAVTFPFFLLMLCAIMDYSWYFYQRGVMTAAARAGCEAAGRGDPDQEAVADVAAAVMINSLAGQGGIDCGDEVYACEISVEDFHLPPNNPPRMVCSVTSNYRSLTGFLGDYNADEGWGVVYLQEQLGWESMGRLIPGTMTGRAVAIYEESD